MSTDYFIFFQSDDSCDEVIQSLCEVEGVNSSDGLTITGLICVTCEPLSPSHQECMLEDYGEYGLNVNWLIMGTYDKVTDPDELIERLYRCAALLVNEHPDKPLSLMRNGESFYVFNKEDQLILSPIYLKAIPVITSLFNKPFTVDEMAYWTKWIRNDN